MKIIMSKNVKSLQKYAIKMIVQSLSVVCCTVGRRVSANVSLLELVAAYGKLFFHNRPSEVMKSKRTTYRKTSHKF
jgi:hypothetical protein